MKSIIFILCLLWVSLSFAIAQNCNTKRYDELIKGGNIALDSGKFVEAIQYYNSAKDYCPKKAKETDKMILEVVQKIDEQKKQTEQALQKANKLINAFYFHEDKFALAYGKMKEGYQN
jgi:tetratricopeptide (TPR) repeat protein